MIIIDILHNFFLLSEIALRNDHTEMKLIFENTFIVVISKKEVKKIFK